MISEYFDSNKLDARVCATLTWQRRKISSIPYVKLIGNLSVEKSLVVTRDDNTHTRRELVVQTQAQRHVSNISFVWSANNLQNTFLVALLGASRLCNHVIM